MAGRVRNSLVRLAFAAVVVIIAVAIAAALSSERGPNGVTLHDRWIAMKLRVHYDVALGRHPDLEVSVSHGLVTLSGALATPSEQRKAVAIARDTGGVVGVVDMTALEAPARRRAPPAPH